MKATKTTTIQVEIKGQQIELTEAEARELASALNGLLGIPETLREPWPTPQPYWPGIPTSPSWRELIVTSGSSSTCIPDRKNAPPELFGQSN